MKALFLLAILAALSCEPPAAVMCFAPCNGRNDPGTVICIGSNCPWCAVSCEDSNVALTCSP